MSITVKLYSVLQPYADNREMVEVEGRTVGECLQYLVKKYPEMEKELFRTHWKPFDFFDIHVNRERSHSAEMGKQVFDGDMIEVTVLRPGV
jgi:molybdopterin converting factor small subunit